MGDDLSVSAWSPSENRQIRLITHIFAHPNYSIYNFANDIAVLRLISPFMITNTFEPVRRTARTPLDNMKCTVAGWGTTTEVIIFLFKNPSAFPNLNLSILEWSTTSTTIKSRY